MFLSTYYSTAVLRLYLFAKLSCYLMTRLLRFNDMSTSKISTGERIAKIRDELSR